MNSSKDGSMESSSSDARVTKGNAQKEAMDKEDKMNPTDLDAIKSFLRQYITESLLPSAGIDAFEDGDSFLEKGIIDSTGVLELLEFIESKFLIRVQDEEVVPANLDSLDRLSSFIQRKTGHDRS